MKCARPRDFSRIGKAKSIEQLDKGQRGVSRNNELPLLLVIKDRTLTVPTFSRHDILEHGLPLLVMIDSLRSRLPGTTVISGKTLLKTGSLGWAARAKTTNRCFGKATG